MVGVRPRSTTGATRCETRPYGGENAYWYGYPAGWRGARLNTQAVEALIQVVTRVSTKSQVLMSAVSVLVVDDSPTFVDRAVEFLDGYEELEVVGTAGNGPSGLELALQLQPQVVVLDLCLPGMSGVEMIPQFRELLPEAAIVAISLWDADTYGNMALRIGAHAFVDKAEMGTALLPAIRRCVSSRSGQPERVAGAERNPKHG